MHLPESLSLIEYNFHMSKAVCLVSGGLDSIVAAAQAEAEGHELYFLHVNYGQLTWERESRAFNDLADYYAVKERMITRADHLRSVGGSALTDPAISVPAHQLNPSVVPVTYVPFRNANLLAIAVSWAEVVGAGYIYVGAVEEDSSGYPDCRKSFFTAFEKAVDEGTMPETHIRIITPLIRMNKKNIILQGLEMGVPLEKTWSCYRNQERACGSCDSCLLRLRGFREAGVIDPIEYE